MRHDFAKLALVALAGVVVLTATVTSMNAQPTRGTCCICKWETDHWGCPCDRATGGLGCIVSGIEGTCFTPGTCP